MYGIAPAEAEQWFPPLFIDHDLHTGMLVHAGQLYIYGHQEAILGGYIQLVFVVNTYTRSVQMGVVASRLSESGQSRNLKVGVVIPAVYTVYSLL